MLKITKKQITKFFTNYETAKPIRISDKRWSEHVENGRLVLDLRLQGKSFAEIGRMMEISGERVRQIEDIILKKIKKFYK